MSVIDDIIEAVREWISYADDDLRLADHTLKTIDNCPYNLVAYHAQQCVEKYLKAWLIYSGIDFPYIHDISKLLELCGNEIVWVKMLDDAEEITTYATIVRYPRKEEKVTEEKAHRAIQIANNVKETVRTALIQKGMKI
jgi:HEPN domain-containing protein